MSTSAAKIKNQTVVSELGRMTKPQQNYLRCLELWAILHEEIGEAQKVFNDMVWRDSKKLIDVLGELDQIDNPLKELKTAVLSVLKNSDW